MVMKLLRRRKCYAMELGSEYLTVYLVEPTAKLFKFSDRPEKMRWQVGHFPRTSGHSRDSGEAGCPSPRHPDLLAGRHVDRDRARLQCCFDMHRRLTLLRISSLVDSTSLRHITDQFYSPNTAPRPYLLKTVPIRSLQLPSRKSYSKTLNVELLVILARHQTDW